MGITLPGMGFTLPVSGFTLPVFGFTHPGKGITLPGLGFTLSISGFAAINLHSRYGYTAIEITILCNMFIYIYIYIYRLDIILEYIAKCNIHLSFSS